MPCSRKYVSPPVVWLLSQTALQEDHLAPANMLVARRGGFHHCWVLSLSPPTWLGRLSVAAAPILPVTHRPASIGPWLISHVTYLSPPALGIPCSHWCMRLWGLLSTHMCLLPLKQGLRSCQQTCKHRSLLAFVTHLDTALLRWDLASWVGSGRAGGATKESVYVCVWGGGEEQGLKSNGQVWLMEMGARRSMFLFPPSWVERLKSNQLHLWESMASLRAPSLLFILPHFSLPPFLPPSLLSWDFPPNKGLANKPVPLAQFHRESRWKH